MLSDHVRKECPECPGMSENVRECVRNVRSGLSPTCPAPHDRTESAHHGLAGVRLESTFWHSLQHGQVKVYAMVDLALSGSPPYGS